MLLTWADKIGVLHGDHVFTNESSQPIHYDDLVVEEEEVNNVEVKKTFKEMVLGKSDGDGSAGMKEGSTEKDVAEAMEIVDSNHEKERFMVEEKVVGDHECPVFSLSTEEETRIQQPWRNGLIVKLLGRKIGYRALENRFTQLWVKKGVISIIDLGNDFFLVAFSATEDRDHALAGSPWLIYDHYLIVREWSPNFQPAQASIDKAAVWVRISELPIEYYDSAFLHFVGNRIGHTMKVEKNTLSMERGKYARMCVEVDLTKPLLAVFELKGRRYKVQYEGLHFLCLACGRFGHYKEGCPAKANQPECEVGGNEDGGGDKDSGGDSLWSVVKKTGRFQSKPKGKEGGDVGDGGQKNSLNENVSGKGSRFSVLNEERDNQEDSRQQNKWFPYVEIPNGQSSKTVGKKQMGVNGGKNQGGGKGGKKLDLIQKPMTEENHGQKTQLLKKVKEKRVLQSRISQMLFGI